jgi:hypothetical protein
MNTKLIDSKIKALIQVCRDTQNHRKLTLVGFTLMSNILDEIGIKLGIRPRNKQSGEKIFQYMEVINSILVTSLEISLFQEEVVNLVKLIEMQVFKRDFNIPIQYIKKIFDIYYEFRKLDIPNLHEYYKDEELTKLSNANLYSHFLSGKIKPEQNSDAFKTIILHKLREKEYKVQRDLSEQFNKDLLQKAIYLKRLKGTLKRNGNNKIRIRGQLKDNINYQKSVEEIVGYCFIGACILFFLLGFVIIIEAVIYPSLSMALSLLILIFFSSGALLLIIYRNYFLNKGG